MPALFVFLFKVNIALLLFCAGYYLVLSATLLFIRLTAFTCLRPYICQQFTHI
jgi:hypothetical protein